MDVEHVRLGQPPDHPPQVHRVRDRLHAARQLQRLDTRHAGRARPPDHPRLAAPLANERHVVTRTLQLHRHAGRPVRVRRPAPARHDLPDGHAPGPAGPRRRRAAA